MELNVSRGHSFFYKMVLDINVLFSLITLVIKTILYCTSVVCENGDKLSSR